MITTDFKSHFLGLGFVLALLCGAFRLWPAHSPSVAVAQPTRPPSDAPAGTKDGKVKELLKERLAVLRGIADLVAVEYQHGRRSFEGVHQARRAVLDAELELCGTDKEWLAVLEKML
jgi:hypothetical protein